MAKEKTVKMRFSKDMYYNDRNVPMYSAGKVYDIPMPMVDRWLKRGGVLITDEIYFPPKQAAPAPVAPPVVVEPVPVKETLKSGKK